MRLAVLAESAAGERRVAATPETVREFAAAGWSVAVERGAGRPAGVPDDAYTSAGADVVEEVGELVRDATVVLSVQPAELATLRLLGPGTAVVSMLAPTSYAEHVGLARDRGLTAFALELIPRTTRAQAMDVLSSQALVAGYRAALAAAERLPGLFPMFTTAGGTVSAVKVLVLGTGVAGLQAVATARRLGAETWAYDIRPSAAGEVASLGARFLDLDLDARDDEAGAGDDRDGDDAAGGYARLRSEELLAAQRRLLLEQVGRFDVLLTTAAVPGRPAPLLVTAEMVERMRPGSVVVDLAAENGGNCALTRPGEEVDHGGVRIHGPLNLASEAPRAASELFSRNVAAFVLLMTNQGRFAPDFADDVVAGCCVTRDGRLVHPVARQALGEDLDRPADPTGGGVEEHEVPPAAPIGARTGTGSEARPGTVDEVAGALRRSRNVVVVPGYGLAVAQAQHTLSVLGTALDRRGVAVSYALHPVAGRLPGQLNGLLDQAGVEPERILALDQANAVLPETDTVLVVGANDVVNPSARTPTRSPISGMPVLDVDRAREVVVLTRSRGPGFAGVDNPLFSAERTTVVLGDLQDTLIGLVAALTSLP